MTLDSWEVHGYLCDGLESDGIQCNAVTDHSDDIAVVKIMAAEDGWVLDGDLSYCPRHKDQLPG